MFGSGQECGKFKPNAEKDSVLRAAGRTPSHYAGNLVASDHAGNPVVMCVESGPAHAELAADCVEFAAECDGLWPGLADAAVPRRPPRAAGPPPRAAQSCPNHG